MVSITYKGAGGRYWGNGINTEVRCFPAQSIATIHVPKEQEHHSHFENFPKSKCYIEETLPRSAIAKQTVPPSMSEMSGSYEAPKHRINRRGDAETTDDDDDVR